MSRTEIGYNVQTTLANPLKPCMLPELKLGLNRAKGCRLRQWRLRARFSPRADESQCFVGKT